HCAQLRTPRRRRMRAPPELRGYGSSPSPWTTSVHELEEPGCPHAAADTHRHDAVFRLAAPAFEKNVARHARARHAVRMADRDGAAIDVELLVRNADTVRAVEHLA